MKLILYENHITLCILIELSRAVEVIFNRLIGRLFSKLIRSNNYSMHTIIRILLDTGGMPALHIYKTLIQCITQTSKATCLHYAFQQNASIINPSFQTTSVSSHSSNRRHGNVFFWKRSF